MIHLLDTGFLVAAEVKEHTDQAAARAFCPAVWWRRETSSRLTHRFWPSSFIWVTDTSGSPNRIPKSTI